MHSIDDKSKPERAATISQTLTEMRVHFTFKNGPQRYLWSLPDIPYPMPEQCIPDFVQSLNCNPIHDTLRIPLDAIDEDICTTDCTKQKRAGETACQDHMLTLSQFASLHDAWKYWQGIIMIADAGATTCCHWDKFALGTWISCHEGEIGMGWLSHPSAEAYVAWQSDNKTMVGIWLFKVLRPGDAVYMPPGTVHMAFRQSQGKQTLGFVGHVLRRSELVQWLGILELEVKDAVEEHKAHRSARAMGTCFRGYCWALRLLEQADTAQSAAKFGGLDGVKSAKRSLSTFERYSKQLHILARKH